jgi:cell division septation protein DedD
MDIKFEKDSAGNEQGAADGKGKQNALLVVLLVLVCALAYIYFFTGLIKPVQEQKSAEAPAASQVAKKPLPSPDGAPAKADAGVADEKKDAAVAAVKPEAAPAPPAAVPAPAAAKPAAPVAAKPKEEQKKPVEEAQTAVKKPLPGAVKPAAKTAAPAEAKKPVVAESKPQPPREVEKKPAEVAKAAEKKPAAPAAVVAKAKTDVPKPARKEAAAPAKITGTGPWTLLVGNYVLEEVLAKDLARVRTAGLDVFVVPGAPKKTHMNRLLLAEFTDRDSAQAELAKLKKYTSDAFIIESAGMHSVYAGSYLLDSPAASEKERLGAAGFRLTVRQVDVSIPTKNLTAGSFTEKSTAEEALKKLRAADIKATVTRK